MTTKKGRKKTTAVDAYDCFDCKTRHTTENMVAYCAACFASLRARLQAVEAVNLKLIEERDEAEAKWHAHQKNVPCAGCEGGHDTFWKSVVESPQWKAWVASGPEWDVYECEECGHISQAHFQAFMAFALSPAQPTEDK